MRRIHGMVLGCLLLLGAIIYLKAIPAYPTSIFASADAAAILSLPAVVGSIGGALVVPVSLAPQGNAIYSLDLIIGYDAEIVVFDSATTGLLVDDWSIVSNGGEAGQIRIGLAGAEPIVNNGIVFLLTFRVTTQSEQAGPLWFESAQLNEGSVAVQPVPGLIEIRAPTPTATVTLTPTLTTTLTPSPTPSATMLPSATGTATPSPTATQTAIASPTQSPTFTVTPTSTPADTVTPTATLTSTATPTVAAVPFSTATSTPTPTIAELTSTPTATPTPIPAHTATSTSTTTPTVTPSSTVAAATPTPSPTATMTPTMTPTSVLSLGQNLYLPQVNR